VAAAGRLCGKTLHGAFLGHRAVWSAVAPLPAGCPPVCPPAGNRWDSAEYRVI